MSEREIGIFETKTHLSEIVERVMRGERIFITRRGQRVAELRPIRPERLPLAKGEASNPGYAMAPDFDEPLDDMAEYS
jgi:prevent-host-death family protein